MLNNNSVNHQLLIHEITKKGLSIYDLSCTIPFNRSHLYRVLKQDSSISDKNFQTILKSLDISYERWISYNDKIKENIDIVFKHIQYSTMDIILESFETLKKEKDLIALSYYYDEFILLSYGISALAWIEGEDNKAMYTLICEQYMSNYSPLQLHYLDLYHGISLCNFYKYEMALPFLKNCLNSQYNDGLPSYYMGYYYWGIGDYAKSQIYLEESIQIFIKLQKNQRLLLANNLMGIIYALRFDYINSEAIYLNILDSMQVNNNKQLEEILYNLLKTYISSHQYQKGISLVEKYQDLPSLIHQKIYLALTWLYYCDNQLVKAKKYCIIGLSLVKDEYTLLLLLIVQNIIDRKYGKESEALLEKVLSLTKERNHSEELAVLNLAYIYYKKCRKYKQALYYYEKCHQYNNRNI